MPSVWKTMTYFAFSLPNKPGELARFTQELSKSGINLIGLWGYASGPNDPRLSCVPESPTDFRRFAREQGYAIEEGKALYRSGEDRPGALVEALKRIADAGINIDAIECVASGDSFGCFIWSAEEHREALARLLA